MRAVRRAILLLEISAGVVALVGSIAIAIGVMIHG
jgi:hypothetical protein